MSTTEQEAKDREQLSELIASRDAILAILRSANIDTEDFEFRVNLTINDFAARCVEGKAASLDDDGDDVVESTSPHRHREAVPD